MFLADLFTLDMNIGSGFFRLAIDLGKDRAFADLLTITVSLAGYTITYNLVDFLIILGISIDTAVILVKLMHPTILGGFFGEVLLHITTFWLFLTFVSLSLLQGAWLPISHFMRWSPRA